MMRLVIDNTIRQRILPSAANAGGVSPLPASPAPIAGPATPTGDDGHLSEPRAAARAAGPGQFEAPHYNAQAVQAVTLYSPWKTHREYLP